MKKSILVMYAVILIKVLLLICCISYVLIVFSDWDLDKGIDVFGGPVIPVEAEEYFSMLWAFCGLGLAALVYIYDYRRQGIIMFEQYQKKYRLVCDYKAIVNECNRKITALNEQVQHFSELETHNLQGKLESNDGSVSIVQQEITMLNETLANIQDKKNIVAERMQDLQISPDFYKVALSKLRHCDSFGQLEDAVRMGKKGEKAMFLELEIEINNLFPGFSQVLCSHFPVLKEKQLHLCLLLKAEFPTKDISCLLCMHHSSVSHLKSRMFASLNLEDASIENLNDFIRTL